MEEDLQLSDLIDWLIRLRNEHGNLPVYGEEYGHIYTPQPRLEEEEKRFGELYPRRIVL